jgi:hypothetical protein
MTLPTPTELTVLATTVAIAAGLVAFFLRDFRLALEIGLVAGALFLAAGVAHTYKQQGVDDQVTIDKPLLAAQVQLTETYKAANAKNLEAVASLTKAYHDQDVAIANLEAVTRAARAQTAAAWAKAEKDAAGYTAAAARFQARMLQPPDGGDECEEADSVLREVTGGVAK